MTLFFYIDLFYFGKYTTKWVKVEWDIPKIYQYIIFKTLSVQYYENKMQFHNFVDGKTKMVRTHDMRRNYWDYKYLFRYAVRYRYWTKQLYKSISTFISNETLSHSMWLIPPYSPIYFLPLKKLKSTRLSVGLLVSLPQRRTDTIYNSQIITH